MNCEACGHANLDGARFCAKCGVLLPVQAVEGDDPLIGQLVGNRYRITKVLGEGGMGKVYVGEQQMGSTVRKVAVKTLHHHLSQDPSVRARFHRECGTVAQLEHPNTIKFFDFGEMESGDLYIAMEFVKGKPVMDAIEQHGPLAPERVLRIMKQVCGALDEAHKLGIVHRDLKPENIIITENAGETDFVKVLDFGIAGRSEGADAAKEAKLTQQGMVLGTPPYMSPEQFTGKQLDQRSDIYSLGVMVYEMLTGKLPFAADTPWEWATQHMTAKPTPFEVSAPATNIPDPMRRAILRALSKDRDQRPNSCREFFQELSGGGGLTVEAPAMSGSALGAAPSGPTAAMPAVPFAGGPVPATPAAFAAPSAPAFIPPPAPRGDGGKKGGNAGLVIGLGGLLAVLGVGIVVVMMRGSKDDEGEPLTLSVPTASTGQASGASEIKPTDTPPEPTATATDMPAGGTATAAPPATGTTKPTGTATAKPTATGTATATATASGTAPKPTGGAAACDACISAASGGNITSAAASFGKCDDAGKKAQCSSIARSKAPGAVRSAALNGQCPQAKAIAGAASAMGAGSGAVTSALGTCK